MANQEQLDILKQGVKVWNSWRQLYPDVKIDLSKANLNGANLGGANLGSANLGGTDLSGAILFGANLSGVHLFEANLSRANLSRADLSRANLGGANLGNAKLGGANLSGAYLAEAYLVEAILRTADLRTADLHAADLRHTDLFETNLSGANLLDANLGNAELGRTDLKGASLSRVNLSFATLVETNLTEATLTNCNIYGISAWSVKLKGAVQNNLVITRKGEPTITVDNLEVAQFIYLLLNNSKIREVIDTITSKVVLILGRFTPERKAILDTIRKELNKRNYTPVLFDFEKPASRDITETISTLAHISRFVIADLTDAKSIPQELMLIVPNLTSVPVQPLLLSSQREYGMFEHFTRYPWVLPIYHYSDEISLLAALQENIIAPAEQKAKELEKR